MDDVEKSIGAMKLAIIGRVFAATEERILSMKKGDKFFVSKFAEELAIKERAPVNHIISVMRYLVDDYPKFKIKPGKNGGFQKVED